MTTQPAHVPTDTPLSSSPRASSRALVLLALLGALLQTLGGVLETLDRVEAGSPGFGFRTVLIGLAYLCLLGAVIELRRSTTAGRGRVVRVALMVAGAGWALRSRADSGPTVTRSDQFVDGAFGFGGCLDDRPRPGRQRGIRCGRFRTTVCCSGLRVGAGQPARCRQARDAHRRRTDAGALVQQR